MKSTPKLLAPWRRSFQTTIGLLLLAIPFVRVGEQSLLRFDIPSLTLYLWGQGFRIEEMYLFGLLGISLIFTFLLVTMVLGRVWCGWACPQTVFSDLLEAAAGRLGLNTGHGPLKGGPAATVLFYLFTLALALLLGANFVWYFKSPYQYLSELLTGDLTIWPLGTTLVLALVLFLDLALLRRLFCRDFCPYGRFQTVLVDPATLTLGLHPKEAKECIDCKACVKHCPMEIDIRQGFQIECINCAKCLDSCRQVMAVKGRKGLIRYFFGQEARGAAALLNPRMAGLFMLVLVLWTTLGAALITRPQASLKLARSATIGSRLLKDGRMATFFNGSLANRTGQQQTFQLTVGLENGLPLEIKGMSSFQVAGGNKMAVNLAVASQAFPEERPIVFTLLDRDGVMVQEIRAFLTPYKEKKQ